MTEPAIAVQKAYDWVLWVFPKARKFARDYKYSLGQSLTGESLNLLLNLVEASYQSRNAGALGQAVRDANRVRYLVRLAKDLKAITVQEYEFAAKQIDEIGRMAGGWLKSAREQRNEARG